ncbi:hypothetical protein BG011_000097, partial [Mortierella polycephala]
FSLWPSTLYDNRNVHMRFRNCSRLRRTSVRVRGTCDLPLGVRNTHLSTTTILRMP